MPKIKDLQALRQQGTPTVTTAATTTTTTPVWDPTLNFNGTYTPTMNQGTSVASGHRIVISNSTASTLTVDYYDAANTRYGQLNLTGKSFHNNGSGDWGFTGVYAVAAGDHHQQGADSYKITQSGSTLTIAYYPNSTTATGTDWYSYSAIAPHT